jgi:DNA-binding MarR family transcriptional regulator
MKSTPNTKIQILFWKYIVPKYNISLATREVFLYLLKMCGSDPPDTNVVSRINEQIALDLTLSVRSVKRAINSLIEMGLIIRLRKGISTERSKSQSKYRILTFKELIDKFLNESERADVERQLQRKSDGGQNVPLRGDKMSPYVE